MNQRAMFSRWGRALVLLPGLIGLLGLGALAQAQPEPPTRVGRVAEVKGEVRRFDSEQNRWQATARNQPVLQGDRISVGPGGSAELQVGASTLRLAADTEIEALRLDDQRLQIALARGSLGVRLSEAEVASDFEVVTPEASWQPLRDGLYRIDRRGELSSGSNWRGLLRATTPEIVLTVEPGQRLELPPGAGNAQARWSQPADDAFAAALLRSAELAGSTPDAVPSQMTGVTDLARHGDWQQHPQFGWVWTPRGMAPNWAPYRHGQWTWVQPWGWTWVDVAPWGFAPYHYGRWFLSGNRWFWAPGPVQARPVRPRHLGPPPLGFPHIGHPPPMVPGPGFDHRGVPGPWHAPIPMPAPPPPSGWLHRHDGPPGHRGDDYWLHRGAPPPARHAAPPRERTSPRPSAPVESATPPAPSTQPAPRTGPFGGRPVGAAAPAPAPTSRTEQRERSTTRPPAPG